MLRRHVRLPCLLLLLLLLFPLSLLSCPRANAATIGTKEKMDNIVMLGTLQVSTQHQDSAIVITSQIEKTKGEIRIKQV